jgi:hypothetical protein
VRPELGGELGDPVLGGELGDLHGVWDSAASDRIEW